eukprot:755160-Hanusia_phi.AAC.2
MYRLSLGLRHLLPRARRFGLPDNLLLRCLQSEKFGQTAVEDMRPGHAQELFCGKRGCSR